MTTTKPRRMPYHSQRGAGGDGCEWNPTEDRESKPGDFHFQEYRAKLFVGKTDPWRLCASCAQLEVFRKFRARSRINPIVEPPKAPPGPSDEKPSGKHYPYKDLSIEGVDTRVAVVRTGPHHYDIRVFLRRKLTDTYPSHSRALAHRTALELAAYHGQLAS